MKNRIISVFLYLVMILTFIPTMSTFAQTGELISMFDRNTGKIYVTLPYIPQEDAWLVAASYDSDGCLVDIEDITLKSDDSINQVIESLSPSSTYKVFMIKKDTIEPLCKNSYGVFPNSEIIAQYDRGTKKLYVTLPFSPQEEAWLVAASYDAEEHLIDKIYLPLNAGADTNQVIESITPAEIYKVFMLNKDTLQPLCKNSCGSFNSGGTGGSASGQYSSLVTAKGQVYVPMIDGVVAHATAMAVDAYVEATQAKENAFSLFEDTSATYKNEDNKTAKVNKIAQIAKTGTDAEKEAALKLINDAMDSLNQAVSAAAVLDVAAEKSIKQTKASIQAEISLLSVADKNQAEALKWAEDLSAKWDSLPQKDRLRGFADMMGVDARTAFQALSDAQEIINGKYTNDAKFYDICTRTAIGVKSAAKVGMFATATVATGGAAAAGTLTAAQAAGFVVGGVDCVIEVGRAEAKILLGDDHEIVQKMEDSTAAKVYDTTMFIYGVATFDPKTASTGEKLLFVEDLIEKDIDTYQNVQVLMDESTGLVIDRIEGETKKICVEYTRIESEMASRLAPAAEEVLGADKTGILGIDPSLNDGSKQDQIEQFTENMTSDDVDLAKTYTFVKDGSKTFADKVEEFTSQVDEKVTYEPIDPNKNNGGGGGNDGNGGNDGTGDGGNEGSGDGGNQGTGGENEGTGGGSEGTGEGNQGTGDGGNEGTGGGNEGGGTGAVTPNFPTHTLDFDDIEQELYRDTFYKNGKMVGFIHYFTDGNKRLGKWLESFSIGNGEWAVTEYYDKGFQEYFGWCYSSSWIVDGLEYVQAKSYGCIHMQYIEREYVYEDGWEGANRYFHDIATYFPNGQLERLEKYDNENWIETYEYSPRGVLFQYSGPNFEYTYYVAPAKGVPFDPTGHLAQKTINDYQTIYDVACWDDVEANRRHWGYYIYHGYNYDDLKWVEVTSTTLN